MLGRYAAEVQSSRQGKAISTMAEVTEAGRSLKERLWEIMVRRRQGCKLAVPFLHVNESAPLRAQVEMTPPGTQIAPEAGKKEMALFDVKYKIFRESIDVQRKWRKMVEDVCGDAGKEEEA